MRTKLTHPLRERSHERSGRRGHGRRAQQRDAERHTLAIGTDRAEDLRAGAHSRSDPAVERVRQAGGPLDTAVYTCCCGYLFSAAVSTTVACPHCGSAQAW